MSKFELGIALEVCAALLAVCIAVASSVYIGVVYGIVNGFTRLQRCRDEADAVHENEGEDVWP